MVKFVSKGLNVSQQVTQTLAQTTPSKKKLEAEEKEELVNFLEELEYTLEEATHQEQELSKKLKDDEVLMLKNSEKFLLEAQSIFNVEIIKHIIEFYDPKAYVLYNALADLNSTFARGKKEVENYHNEWELHKEGGLLAMAKSLEENPRRTSALVEHYWIFRECEVENFHACVYIEKPDFHFVSIRDFRRRGRSARPVVILVDSFIILPPIKRKEEPEPRLGVCK